MGSVDYIYPSAVQKSLITVNQQEMLYDSGFVRSRTKTEYQSLFKCSKLGVKAFGQCIKELEFRRLAHSVAMTVKAFFIGIGKFFASPILDAIKAKAESSYKTKFQNGRTALIIIDVQNDFIKINAQGKGLPVTNGGEVVSVINKLMAEMKKRLPGCIVAASLDYHPKKHGSFASSHGAAVFSLQKLNGEIQVMWPEHCVQGTEGAKFAPDLNTKGINFTVNKGLDLSVDSYSAVYDNGKKNKTSLAEMLKHHNITDAVVVGLAKDYCVRFSAEDLKDLDFIKNVTVIDDATKAVAPDSEAKAEQAFKDKGIKLVKSDAYINALPAA